jgi:hypothetical protein
MNERIKELAEQATEIVKCGLNGTSTAESFNRKKFAGLMTTEFIGLLEYEIAMLEKYKTAACNDFDRRWHEGKIVHFNKLIEKTKDHFGVEQ